MLLNEKIVAGDDNFMSIEIESSTVAHSSKVTCSSTNTREGSASSGTLNIISVQNLPSQNSVDIVPPNSVEPVSFVSTSKPVKQNELMKEIDILNAELVPLTVRQRFGPLDEEDGRCLKKIKASIGGKTKRVKRLRGQMQYSRNARMRRRDAHQELARSNPDAAKLLMIHDRPGRPALVDKYPLLIQHIIDCVREKSLAHARRRDQSVRSVRTLSDLTKELNDMGYNISRSSTYYHLLPKNLKSIEGRKHNFVAAPVRLIRATNDLHNQHIDTKFAKANVENAKSFASFCGPKNALVISADDRARVAMGITAAKIQEPMLMHLDYTVKLPDHNYVVAERHKLIPSVYAMLHVEPGGFGDTKNVTYKGEQIFYTYLGVQKTKVKFHSHRFKLFLLFPGPTYIAIRSGKHDSSTALSHSRDLKRIFDLDPFDYFTKGDDGLVLPIIIKLVDGGPDENPRYYKTQLAAVQDFVNYDLDRYITVTNAPGRSAYNPVERRMAPLSKTLAGLVIPHDHFGSHLNRSGKTINDELEAKNFFFAQEVVADRFSSITITGHEVFAEAVAPENSRLSSNEVNQKDEEWWAVHTRSSQYMFELKKCDRPSCCKPFRSKVHETFPNFLPPPVAVSLDKTGFPTLADRKDGSAKFLTLTQALSFFPSENLAHDFFCPSVSEEAIKQRTCSTCKLYFSSAVNLKKHASVHKKTERVKRKVRRVISKRLNELLVEDIADDLNEDVVHNICKELNPNLAWVSSDEIDINGMSFPNNDEQASFPILTIEQLLEEPWIEITDETQPNECQQHALNPEKYQEEAWEDVEYLDDNLDEID